LIFLFFLFFQPLLRRLPLQDYRLGVTGLVAIFKFFFLLFSLFSSQPLLRLLLLQGY